MDLLENPIIQKIATGVAVAALGAVGAGLVATRDTVRDHSKDIAEIRASQAGSSQDVRDIKQAIDQIQIDVARLEERTRPKE